MIKTLREQAYVSMQPSEKKQIDDKRFRVYIITEKLKSAIKEDKKQVEEEKKKAQKK